MGSSDKELEFFFQSTLYSLFIPTDWLTQSLHIFKIALFQKVSDNEKMQGFCLIISMWFRDLLRKTKNNLLFYEHKTQA